MFKAYRVGGTAFATERSFRLVPLVVAVATLCGISFYLGNLYSTEKSNIDDVIKSEEQVSGRSGNCFQVNKVDPFPECNITLQDHTPCTDPKRWFKYDKHRMAFRERHCPPRSERLQCLIPPPPGYKVPIHWPKSRDECWYRNVPYEWINSVKANQNWLKKKGEKFFFPGGGTMFPNGVGEYIDHMEELMPGMKDGSVRTALDTGCGVASWGGELLNRGILTMSLAPRDNHEAQVQFALERGIPAMLGIISTQRLPYPSNSFDMAHCSRCLIPWTEFGGVFLLEVDRILRPGGFWVLSGPPINYQTWWKGWESTEEKEKALLDKIEDLVKRMCWTKYAMKGDLAVWQKPFDNSCYDERPEETYPPVCDDAIEPDAAWYVPMRPCVVPQSKLTENIAVGKIAKWPARLNTPSDRLKLVNKKVYAFKEDTKLWQQRMSHYKNLWADLRTKQIRNVMDMYTEFGGFGAALINSDVWVMNVVSSYSANTLGIVYDRGLIGAVHDWCEAFSTYPRTYDWIHVAGLFTAESHRCEMKDVLLEIDRILRPEGIVVLRDALNFRENAKVLGEAMRWKCSSHDTEVGPADTEGLLFCKKTFWESSEASTV
ncbi:probable methyltransferase PMT21 [Physcomitrium patens]|uniref:Methyltransferase n=1 Tax=Physcomitrium patens TaxID=3218 RepID=A9S2J8_PHYPA|nr:probable methyltransferase PMT21 [Physcomitrium patens]XP_024372736.1 probable methyltransferase PMT21 [Physcomitrium patens]XP_024372744.1 probable methyltransferase PMT21 [Physcomitrium patens]XP_024372754.1 probable methyltransferase PMT21 [Physcomitrium patens]PNR62429.1 hypothetical protein PHYPA_000853 [Physcomitrium patens]|eukprot:XP_024372728.1 probable methyltransferase PMT21 [Physcomitrella patens]